METIVLFLEGWSEAAVAIRLVIATLFGSLVGCQQIIKKHNAGIRTFALVSLGAAMATMINIYLPVGQGMDTDVSRIPAGVVNGIGFLGAGTILVTGKNQVKGLTTAATLWVTAIMGMAVGAGFLWIGTVCFVIIVIANRILQYLSTYVEARSRYMSLYLEVDKVDGVAKLRKFLADSGYSEISINKTREKALQSTEVAISIEIDLKKQTDHQEIINKLEGLKYVSYIEEL